jgi:hypothetical protein
MTVKYQGRGRGVGEIVVVGNEPKFSRHHHHRHPHHRIVVAVVGRGRRRRRRTMKSARYHHVWTSFLAAAAAAWLSPSPSWSSSLVSSWRQKKHVVGKEKKS